jgi:PTS system fructose-specific IIC component
MNADTFLSHFSEKRFVQELHARSKESALSELSRILAADGDVRDPNVLLDMIRRRESLGSTALGKGVAIPHGRSIAAADTRVVFGIARRGIDFEAPDGEACKLFFLIVAPYEDPRHEYLPLLGKIVELVNEKTVREKLLASTTFGDFQAVIREALGE